MGQMGANWEFVGVITKSRVGPDDLTSRYSHNDSHFTPSFSPKSDYSHYCSHAADSPPIDLSEGCWTCGTSQDLFPLLPIRTTPMFCILTGFQRSRNVLQALADDRLSQSRGGIDLLLGDDGAIG
jgi:hypothetical protein